MRLVGTILMAVALALSTNGWTQDKAKDKAKASATQMTIPAGVDREKFKDEALKLEQEALKLPDGPQTGLFKKHHYCITCQNGQRHSCVMPVGGEVGRSTCVGKCLAVCGGGCSVAYNGC